MTRVDEPQLIVFFDGVCNLCNSSVQFLIRKDKDLLLTFCSLQSERGAEAMKQVAKQAGVPKSIILLAGDRYYTKSTAVLKIARTLGGKWALLYPFILIPRALRDLVYDLIARNRYRWFGRSETCMVPDRSVAARFLS
ncbi:MAG: thiol-disulfide oxidoreductase DCC family protein [Chitinophagaceae bacterium]|nr:thiol-disulfide oxidoreductase DCC family protein [Chitinophagaceae bacterium]